MHYELDLQAIITLYRYLKKESDCVITDEAADAYESVEADEICGTDYFRNKVFFYVDRPLSAAIYLGRKSWIRKIWKKEKSRNHSFRRSPALESAIAFSRQGLTEFMIRTMPEVTDKVRLSAIYESRNEALMRNYIRKHSDPKEGAQELRRYVEWLDKRKEQNGRIRRSFFVVQDRLHTENFAVFKMIEQYLGTEPDRRVIQDIQKRLIYYLDQVIDHKKNAKLRERTSRAHLNWYNAEAWAKADVEKHVSYYMSLMHRYGVYYDVTERVTEFMEQGIFLLDFMRQLSGIKKNFVVLHQYEVQMSEHDPKESIMRGKWMKRLMRYAIPDKLREQTDPLTEWLIQRNDRKLVKKAIRQKYIGNENAEALLKYALSLEEAGRGRMDPRIMDLLVAQKNA